MRLCPTCADEAHLDEEGHCERCGGQLLTGADASHLLRDRLGLSIDKLQTLSGMFAGRRQTYPGCSQSMSPMRLRGENVDVCLQCGALWLDAGEHAAIERRTQGEIARAAPSPTHHDPPIDLEFAAKRRRRL